MSLQDSGIREKSRASTPIPHPCWRRRDSRIPFYGTCDVGILGRELSVGLGLGGQLGAEL